MNMISSFSKKKYFRYVVLFYTIVIAVMILFTFYKSGFETKSRLNVIIDTSDVVSTKIKIFRSELMENTVFMDSLSKNIEDIERILSLDPKKLSAIIEIIKELDPSITNSFISNKKNLNDLSKKVETLSLNISDIKQAINPNSIEGILTIARLGDKYSQLQNEYKDTQNDLILLKNEFNSQIEQNIFQVNSQVDRIVATMRWLLLLIIPIIWTTFRDIPKPKDKEIPQSLK